MSIDGREARHRIDLCGVRIEVQTDHADFARYLEAQFPGHRDAGWPARPPDVRVRVRWTEGPRPDLTPRAVFPDWPTESGMGRHIYTTPDRVVWLRVDDAPQIAVAAERRGHSRRFELRHHFSLGSIGRRETLKRLVRWRQLPRLRRHRLSTLTYYAVYYPLWWHLESQGAAHPLHAAGVALHDRALIIAGLPGVGKSALAASFLAVPGAEILADNVLTYDSRQVSGCFEPLLLDAGIHSRLAGSRPLAALGRRHVFAREAFQVPHRTGKVPAGAAVVLTRGSATRLEPLASGECAQILLAINEATKELRRYHALAAVLGLAEREALAHTTERGTRLRRLLAQIPCYRLDLREGEPDEAVSMLSDLMARGSEVAQ